MARFGFISGTVKFYGKTNKYKSDEKEYCLCIKDPHYHSINVAALEEKYPLPKSKKDADRPAKIQAIIDGECVEEMYFNSDFPITKVWVKEGDQKICHDVKNPQLKDMEIVMALTGTHIGAVLTDRLPEEYQSAPFNMEDMDEDDLPF